MSASPSSTTSTAFLTEASINTPPSVSIPTIPSSSARQQLSLSLSRSRSNTPIPNGNFEAANNEIPYPPSMTRVKIEYDKLTNVVQTLGVKVSSVLAKQETEFLGAYRAHMYNVQKELQSLRTEIVEKEVALSSNDRMEALEASREWYRKESLRLDMLCTKSERNEKYMREKIRMVEDDRNWLANQLKKTKGVNKLLRSEVELSVREGKRSGNARIKPNTPGTFNSYDLEKSSTNIHSMKLLTVNNGNKENPPESLSPSPIMLPSMSTPNLGNSSVKKPYGFGSGPYIIESKSTANINATTSNSNAKVAEMQRNLKTIKHELQIEKAANAKFRAVETQRRSEGNELEVFFLECIEEVKKEIFRRRQTPPSTPNRPTPTLAPPVTLSDFMGKDKRAVIETLISKDEVLSLLYEGLFPAQKVKGFDYGRGEFDFEEEEEEEDEGGNNNYRDAMRNYDGGGNGKPKKKSTAKKEIEIKKNSDVAENDLMMMLKKVKDGVSQSRGT